MVSCDIYGRVSTEEQAREGYSIGEQEKRLRLFAEAQGFRINDVLMDGGFSGATLNRPGIQKVIADAKSGRVQKVIVYKLDRLSRSQKDTLMLIEDVFMKNGVSFVSMTESLDTSTPFGIAMIGILACFAQLERSTIAERMMIGRNARVKKGKYHGHKNDVIGFNYDKDTGNLSLNPYDAEMVRTIFQKYIDGDSMAIISRYLNDIGWKGCKWNAGRVHTILFQPLYVGRQRWRGEEVEVEGCPRIISDEVWMRAHSEAALRSNCVQYPKRAGRHITLLGGMLWCGKCGCRYASHKQSGKPYSYYYCINRRNKNAYPHIGPCTNIGWRSEKLDAAVIGEIKKLQLSQDLSSIQAPDMSREVAELEKQLKEIEKKKERLIDLYAVGSLSVDSIGAKAGELDAESASIARKIAELRSPSGKLDTAQAAAALATFADLVDSVPAIELSEVVRQLIQAVTIDDEKIKIQWNFG